MGISSMDYNKLALKFLGGVTQNSSTGELPGLWAADCGLWALGCGPWAVGRGLWAVGCGLPSLGMARACGVLSVFGA